MNFIQIRSIYWVLLNICHLPFVANGFWHLLQIAKSSSILSIRLLQFWDATHLSIECRTCFDVWAVQKCPKMLKFATILWPIKIVEPLFVLLPTNCDLMEFDLISKLSKVQVSETYNLIEIQTYWLYKLNMLTISWLAQGSWYQSKLIIIHFFCYLLISRS